MRFFHLSDLHIGLRLDNHDLHEDQEYILNQIVDLAAQEQPDAICIAGDLYNRSVPSADAVQLFDRFVTKLRDRAPNSELLMISGNHDSGERIGLYRDLLARQHVHLAGLPPKAPEEYIPRVTLKDDYGEVDFYLLPFTAPGMVRQVVEPDPQGCGLSYEESLRRLIGREQIDPERRSVILSHQFYIPSGTEAKDTARMGGEVVMVGNVDAVPIDVLDPFDYAALGHLHKPSVVGSDTRRYCGTPLACSLSEEGQQKAVVVVEMEEKGNIHTRLLPLTPLRQIRRVEGTLQEILSLPGSDDYVHVALADDMEGNAKEVLDQLRVHFPRLLKLESLHMRAAATEDTSAQAGKLTPWEICMLFMPDLESEELELLKEIVAKVEQEEV